MTVYLEAIMVLIFTGSQVYYTTPVYLTCQNNTSMDTIKCVQNCTIVFLIGLLWPSETNGKYCKANKVRQTESDKMECQKLCEWNANCVGISYTNGEQYNDVCYVCLDDNLESTCCGFNFYRRPGIYQTPTF